MNDKQLQALIASTLNAAIAADADLAPLNIKVARSYQQTQQGATVGPAVYFVKLFDRRHGSPQRKDVWDAVQGMFVHTEAQQYESAYQFEAMVPQDPKATTALTESDTLNLISGIMQSDSVLATFRAAGVGIQRITEVRNPYIVDDRDQFEAVPSFDVVLTHTRTRSTTVPAVVTYDANMKGV